MKIKVTATIILVITATFAQDSAWQFMGLAGEKVSAIAVNHENDSIVYAGTMSNYSAGTYGSIFKSIDAGVTWDTLFYGLSCGELSIHPQNPDIIYAALGGANFTAPGVLIFDSEGNWELLNNGIYLDWETDVLTIEIDPIHPDTIYAGTGGFFGGGLYKTVNGGALWELIGSYWTGEIDDDNITGIAINPYNTDELLVCAMGIGTIHKSLDGGKNWTEIFNAETEHMAGGFYDIEIDKVNTDIYYACLPHYGLIKSTDSGNTWELINNGLPDSLVKYIELSPINNDELFLAIGGQGIYHSINGGNSWGDWNNNFNDYFIEELSIAPSGNAIYCGTQEGIYRRTLYSLYSVDKGDIPYTFRLLANYPNPFNSQTVIPYVIKQPNIISIDIIDILGRKITTLTNKFHSPGEYTINWDGTDKTGADVPSGVYFYSITTKQISENGKMILLK